MTHFTKQPHVTPEVFDTTVTEQIRSAMVDMDGQPWFQAASVADMLGYKSTRMVTKLLQDEDKQFYRLPKAQRGNPNVAVLSSKGLLKVVYRSQQPEAEALQNLLARQIRWFDDPDRDVKAANEDSGIQVLHPTTKGTIKTRDIPVPDQRTKPENLEHQRLFTIPQGQPSTSTALMARTLPPEEDITGDREVDAVLWLGKLCATTNDLAALDQALEAAERIKTPADELEKRYSDWLARQPGANPFSVVFQSVRMADIKGKVADARERILVNAEGLSIFGSYTNAMALTPAEMMLEDSAGKWPEEGYCWEWSMEQMDALWKRSVNPASLTECVSELRYWQWLYRIRKYMHQTEYPNAFAPDLGDLIYSREHYIEKLLCIIPPFDHQERLFVADAINDGLIDKGTVYDGREQAVVLNHLLRA